MKIDIKGIDKAVLVANLFNRSKPNGMGFFSRGYDKPMTADEAQKLLDDGQTSFDYLRGRVMKIDVSGDELDAFLYDRDNGQGAANEIVQAIKKSQSIEFQKAEPTNRLEMAAVGAAASVAAASGGAAAACEAESGESHEGFSRMAVKLASEQARIASSPRR